MERFKIIFFSEKIIINDSLLPFKIREHTFFFVLFIFEAHIFETGEISQISSAHSTFEGFFCCVSLKPVKPNPRLCPGIVWTEDAVLYQLEDMHITLLCHSTRTGTNKAQDYYFFSTYNLPPPLLLIYGVPLCFTLIVNAPN